MELSDVKLSKEYDKFTFSSKTPKLSRPGLARVEDLAASGKPLPYMFVTEDFTITSGQSIFLAAKLRDEPVCYVVVKRKEGKK